MQIPEAIRVVCLAAAVSGAAAILASYAATAAYFLHIRMMKLEEPAQERVRTYRMT